MLTQHVDIVDPWTVTTRAEVEAAFRDSRQSAFWIEVGDRNYAAIETCDMLVAVLDGEPPDNGTVAEVAWGVHAGLVVIGYRNDLRQCGEDGVPVNLMIFTAIQRSGGHWASTLTELEAAVARVAGRISSVGPPIMQGDASAPV
jgi:nucleoside 2-deoxyribosyltransferase